MRSLDLNLASRPFRNNTLVWAAYVTLLVAAIGFTYWNVSSFRRYKHELVELDAIQGNMEQEQSDLRARHGQIQRAVKGFDVKSIGRRTSKANEVIEWKAFSWTRLFNRLEEMLPYKVRMSSVRPIFRDRDRNREDGDLRQSVAVNVEGMARDLAAFHQIQTELIQHDSFGHVLPRFVDRTDNGEYSFGVDFLYYPGEAAADADADADAGEQEPPPPAVEEPAVPEPAEVTDEWAEQEQPGDAEGQAVVKDAPPKSRRLPQVEPDKQGDPQ